MWFIEFWFEPSWFKHPRFVVGSVAMDWAMSSCMTDQKKGYHASEYLAAHWRSSLKVSLSYTHSTLHPFHAPFNPLFVLAFSQKRWMERKVSCERGEGFLLLKVRTVDEVLQDKALMDLRSSDGRCSHWAARTDRCQTLFLFFLKQEHQKQTKTATGIQMYHI